MVGASEAGFLGFLDARVVGETAVLLGAGRTSMDQALDYGAGIYLDRKAGDRVQKGESVARLYTSDPAKLTEAYHHFKSAFRIDKKPPRPQPVVRKILR
jgi:thymidine phosphorylase